MNCETCSYQFSNLISKYFFKRLSKDKQTTTKSYSSSFSVEKSDSVCNYFYYDKVRSKDKQALSMEAVSLSVVVEALPT